MYLKSLFFIALLSCVCAGKVSAPKAKPIVNLSVPLTHKNFKKVVNDNPIVFVKFFAPW
jgi:hypothetical protein